MIIPGQRSLPLAVHNRFRHHVHQTRAFKHELFHISWLRRILRRISSIIRLRIQAFRALHTRFWVRHTTTDARQQCSCCQRSATMFAVFLHCIAVLCVVVMSHPQPSLSGTGVLWVSIGTHRCVDPPRQGGGSTMRQLVRCVDCGCRP